MALTGPPKRVLTILSGLWYFTLGLAFAALAWRNVLYAAPIAGTLLRCVIAVFFCVLGVLTLKGAKKR